MTKEHYPITGEYLHTILRSPDFARNMRALNRHSEKREQTFFVAQNFYTPEYAISNVGIGTTVDCRGADVSLNREFANFRALYRLIDVHSHPGGPTYPSMGYADHVGDIFIPGDFKSEYSVAVNPIAGVITPSTRDPILVLFQENALAQLDPDDLISLKDTFYGLPNLTDPRIVEELLISTRYFNALGRKYSEITAEDLNRFAFVPKEKL